MREWFTVAEAHAVGSAALPDTVRGINLLIEREAWCDDARFARARETGRGGGWEFHLSRWPAEVQARLIASSADQTTNETRSQALWSRFERLPQKVRDEAARRLAIIERIELLAAGMAMRVAVALAARDTGVSSSTLWNWLREAQQSPRADRLAALAPRHSGRTKTAECDPRAWDFFKADYLRPEQPGFEACYRRLLDAARQHGWQAIPSMKTMRRRIERDIPRGARTIARNGADAARRIFPHQTRDHSAFTALQAVNADTHTFDVFVRTPDGAIARPAMVAIQDVYSGMILAHRIAAGENWTVIRHAFADAIESFGVPEQAWFDNGRAFASKWMTGGALTRYRFKIKDDDPTGILPQLGVQVHWTTPYHGQAKPIERAFRDLCEEIAKHPRCAGAYTGNSPVTKPDNYAARAVPLEEFRALVATEIVRHNTRPGRRSAVANGRSFAAAYQASIESGALIRRASSAQRRMLLLAAEGIVARKPTGELTLADNRYWAEPLAEHIGRKLVARFDPDDLLQPIAVYTLDGRYLCDAPCIAATGFDDIAAAREHARNKRAWFKAQRELLDLERRMTISEVAKLLPAPAPIEAPPAKVVRLVASAGARGIAADIEDGDRLGDEAFGRAVRALEAQVIPFRNDEGGPA